MAINEKEHVVFKNPQQYDERTNLAGTCSTNLGIEFPALVDTMDNSTETAYTSWPDRIYVIDARGRIAFKTDPGPFGFKTQLLADVLPRLSPPNNDGVNH
jgi:iodothyronine deiodinase-like protein